MVMDTCDHRLGIKVNVGWGGEVEPKGMYRKGYWRER